MTEAAPSAAAPPPPSLEDLLGPNLVKGKQTVKTSAALKKKDFVLFYFSASWCPPCQAFTPILKDFYAANNKSVEIIYISADHSDAEFAAYFAKMPWLALPYSASDSKGKLTTLFAVRGIPSLMALTSEGLVVSTDARTEIQGASSNAKAYQALVNTTWKSKEPVRIQDAIGASSSWVDMVKQLVFTVLKNPIYIFGMLYLLKSFMRKMGGTDTTTIEEAAISNDHEPIPDDEF